MGKKFYAIKEGFDFSTNEKIENKIVNTWAECSKYVKGVKGAKYKSFESIEEANKFLIEGRKLLKVGVDKYPTDCFHIFVDGSYNIETERYSYGLVVVKDNVIKYIDGAACNDTSKKSIRQIAGELEAAIRGVEYAIRNNEKKVVIFHDYEGIAHHATGFWDRKEESSKEYYNKMNGFINSGMEIIFVKVDSHTGELMNELADEVCKKYLGIKSDSVVDKWLENNTLYVENEEVKKIILSLTKNKDEKIIINNSTKNIVSDKIENKSEEIINNIIEKLNVLSIEKQNKVLEYINNIIKS